MTLPQVQLLPGEANPTQARTMDLFQGDKVRLGIALIQTYRYIFHFIFILGKPSKTT